MANVVFDFHEFERKAQQMGIFARDQLPFAIMRTLNDTMYKGARPEIIQRTWPSAFTVRERNFARAAIRVDEAKKTKLSAGLYDALGRAQLGRHASGGTKTARGSLAIPQQSKVRLTARGARPKPRAIDGKFPKRAVRVIKGKGIFVGKGGRLHLWYLFRPSASIDKRFRFYEDFTRVVLRDVPRYYPPNIQRAIATAFGR